MASATPNWTKSKAEPLRRNSRSCSGTKLSDASIGWEPRRFRQGQARRHRLDFLVSSAADENLSPEFRATGRDANGGYAQYMTIGENYAYPIPDVLSDEQAAPLLCAGRIGYRALRLTNLCNGDRLGLTGFGGSAHLVLQLVRHRFPDTQVYVFARDAAAQLRSRARCHLGRRDHRAGTRIVACRDRYDSRLDADCRSAGESSPRRSVGDQCHPQRGRRQGLPAELELRGASLDGREIKSVANITHADIAEFLPLAAEIPLRPEVATYRLEDANRALLELKHGSVTGAKVLVMDRVVKSHWAFDQLMQCETP